MTTTRCLTVLAFVLACGALLWQQRQLRSLQLENARLLADVSELNSRNEETSRLRQKQADQAELERLRMEQSELLRLRGEVSLLRQRLKDAQPIKRNPSTTTPVAPPVPVEEATAPVETYRAVISASLISKQTLVTGGWAVPNNKRALVLVEPAVGRDADRPGQIVIQTRFVEMAEETLSRIGLDWMKADGRENSAQSTLSAEQAENLLNALKESQGVNLLSAPRISTMDGQQARITLCGTRTIDGVVFEVGPSVDVVPRVSPDGASVHLTVIAQLRYQTPAAP